MHAITKKAQKGFTLIELLVVIGIIAILAAIVIIAINPARQFAQARNSQRQSNLETILNAIGQDMADNKGVFDAAGGKCAGTTLQEGSTTIYTDSSAYVAGVSGAAGHEGLGCLSPTYIAAGLPTDPSGPAAPSTGYDYNYASSTGRVLICAPTLEPAVGNGAFCVSR